MPTYNGNATANGEAYTKTEPASLVTSTASASATSDVSQQDANMNAQKIAEDIANSAAQNDANVITQTINISTTSLKGQYSNLNIYYATPTDVSSNSTFTGIIVTPAVFETSSIIITFLKPIYEINSLSTSQPTPTTKIPNAYINGTYQLTYENFKPPKLLPPNSPAGTKSILTGTRTSYITIPKSNNTYNNVIVTNVTIYCNIYIDETTNLSDINGSFLSTIINNKMTQSISINESDLFKQYIGVVIKESYSSDSNFNYQNLVFDNASISGSSINIYPYTVKTA